MTISKIKIREEMPEVRFPASVGYENVLCRFKWDYPIVNLMSGHIRNCCRVPKQVITSEQIKTYGKDAIMNLPYEKERRLEKLLGVTHIDCESCVRLEHNGATSPRSGAYEWARDYYVKRGLGPGTAKQFDEIVQRELKDLSIDSPILHSDNPQMLEIVLGNHCNLKCTYCSVHYSTQWAQELIKNGELTEEQYKRDFPEAPPELEPVFWEWFYDIGRHKVETINILGGEPTYVPKFYDLLDKLIAAYKDLGPGDRPRPELGVLSNMNTALPQMQKLMDFMPRLAEHFLFRLQPSIEALGARAEYIRFGLKWEVLERNVNMLLTHMKKQGLNQNQFSMGFQIAINTFSLSSLPDFIRWVQALNEKYDVELGLMKNVVSFPRHHNPLILTPDFARYVAEAIEFIKPLEEKNDRIARTQKWYGSWWSYREHLLEGLHQSMSREERSDFDLQSRVHFYEFVKRNDARRGCDFRKTYPEYRDFWRVCERAAGVPPTPDPRGALEWMRKLWARS